MKNTVLVGIMLVLCLSVRAVGLDTLYQRLEFALEHRADYMDKKERKIERLKRLLARASSSEEAFCI